MHISQINGKQALRLLMTASLALLPSLAWGQSLPNPIMQGQSRNPLQYGAKGDGVTDDTAAMQAAVNAAAVAGVPLFLDGNHKYLITSTIASTGSPDIEGAGIKFTIYTTSCPSGIIVNSNITAFSLTGPTARVHGVCIQMASAPGVRTSGSAISVGATVSTQQGQAEISGNTIVFPYDGISVGGATTGATQTNGDTIADNVIISPSDVGIANGRNSTGTSTNGTTIRDNQIYCGGANSSSTGIAIFDGSIRFYGADGGPYNCNVGTALTPQSGQQVGGLFDGVLGDTTISESLLISPASGGAVEMARFVGAWAGYSSGTVNTAVLMSGTGLIKEILFDGLVAHSFAGQTTPIIDIENGVNITITGSHIIADGGGTTIGAGIKLGSATFDVLIASNFIGGFNGTLNTGVQVITGAGAFSIVGNTISTNAALVYSPSSAGTDTAVIANNLGVDNYLPSVASAAAITLPVNPFVQITGTTTVNTMGGAWSNRVVKVMTVSGLSFGRVPNGVCVPLTLGVGATATLTWASGLNCWLVG